ncbi:MAG: thiamine biosynthesis protein ApbE, partial [Betaproteobacteria bacterium RIFCSPLOWO2_12_FULL_62_13]
ERAEVAAAYRQASARFADILEVLVQELAQLRTPLGEAYPLLRGPVARRMLAACWPYRAIYITPMAAVAGAAADEILQAMLHERKLLKAYVNNGGDIALHLAQDNALTLGVVNNADHPAIDATVTLSPSMPVRGLATSGWRGRSQSLGIADAVTVFAADAAAADAAATMVANAVDVEHPAISRRPARALRADSDLGDLPVTVAVDALPAPARDEALASGCARAKELQQRGLIFATYLALQGEVRAVLPAGTLVGQTVCRTAGG